MNTITFIEIIEDLAPLSHQCSWDCSGFQVSSSKFTQKHNFFSINKALVTLDCTLAVVEYAHSINADIIITHHPLTLSPISLSQEQYYSSCVRALVSYDIALYSAHTSLDATTHGIAGFLANEFALESVSPLEITHTSYLHSLILYSQKASLIKETMLQNSIPYVDFSTTDCTITLLVEEKYCKKLCTIIQKLHIPYTLIPTKTILQENGIGCVGYRNVPLQQKDFFSILKHVCGVQEVKLCGTIPQSIQRIAYCGGAGSSFIPVAEGYKEPVDVYITGEIKHHHAVYSSIPLIDVGHFSLEEAMMRVFADELRKKSTGVIVEFFPSKEPLSYFTL